MVENEVIEVGGVELTDKEKAQLAIAQWKRQHRIDWKEQANENPSIKYAVYLLGAVLVGRIVWYRLNRHKPGYVFENYLLETRVYAQGSFVLSIVGYTLCTGYYNYFFGDSKQKKKEETKT